MNILDQLAEHARERVALAKRERPLADLRREALALPKGDFAFEKALSAPELAFICISSSIAQINSAADAPSSFAS